MGLLVSGRNAYRISRGSVNKASVIPGQFFPASSSLSAYSPSCHSPEVIPLSVEPSVLLLPHLKMPSVRAEAILAAANIFWQITLAAWDNTGGSSGQDSVLAGIIATVDQSNGVLYLWALLNFITDSSLIWSGRWGMIHPTRMDRLIKTRLEITLRSHWRHIVNKSRRFAELDWIHINHESPAMSVASTPRLAVS
jgi:hypothetical protein